MSDPKASPGIVEADARHDRIRHAGRRQGFSPYPKYKPSGVEWLGDVPEHWEVAPVKAHCRIVNGGTPTSTDPTFWNGSVRWITPEDLGRAKSRTVSSTRRTLSQRGYVNCGAQIAPARSVVLSTRAPIGHVAIIAKPSCTNQGCRSLVPNRSVVDPVFLYYAIRSQRAVLKSLGKGTTFLELSIIDVGSFPVAFPFLNEQRAIAAYLDRETAKIDALIARNEALIKHLKEQRAALISQTVTRGLPPDESRKAGIDPNPKLKPSGVEWLGDVPERWRVGRLKEYGDVISGSAFPIRLQGSTEGALSFYKVSDLTEICSDGQHMDEARNRISYQVAHDLRARIIPKRAIVYAKIGAACLLNRRRITTVKCCIDNNMTAYIPNRLVTHKWAYYWMTSLDFAAVANPGAIPSVSEGYQKTLPIVVPPTLEEQEALTGFLDRQTAMVDEATTLACREIDLLREYRTRLISDVVTGRVDIRCVAGAGVEAE